MTSPNDSSDAMLLPLSEGSADLLLTGTVAPDDAPRGYATVAVLLGSLVSPPTAAELSNRAEAVQAAMRLSDVDAELRSLVEAAATIRTGARRVHRSVALLALTAMAVFLVGGLAFARVLPDPIQNAVSRIVHGVGISVSPNQTDVLGSAGSPAGRPHMHEQTDPRSVAPRAKGHRSPAGKHGHARSHRGPNQQHQPRDPVPGAAGAHTNTPPPSGSGNAQDHSGGSSDQGGANGSSRSEGHSALGSENSTQRPEQPTPPSPTPAGGPGTGHEHGDDGRSHQSEDSKPAED